MKPKISRFVTNKGSRQGKVRSQNLDEACLKRRYHTGYAAIENANTIEEPIFDPRSSIVDSVFDCRLPGVAIVYVFSKPRPKDQC